MEKSTKMMWEHCSLNGASVKVTFRALKRQKVGWEHSLHVAHNRMEAVFVNTLVVTAGDGQICENTRKAQPDRAGLSPAHPKTLTHGSTKQHTLINSGGAVESVKTIINAAEVWTDLSRKKDLWAIKQVRLIFVLLQKIYLWARSKEIYVRVMGALATKVLSRRAKQGRSRNFIAQTSFVCLGRELGTWKTHLLTKDVPS